MSKYEENQGEMKEKDITADYLLTENMRLEARAEAQGWSPALTVRVQSSPNKV